MSCEIDLVPGGRRIGGDDPCFIIADIGQNHQGDVEIAKRMIAAIKESGADCAKMQKCDIESKFTKAALERPYATANSWGPTYGEHKRHLEFSRNQWRELKRYAEDEVGILFAGAAADEVRLSAIGFG